jgi:hypothetical protein
MICRNFYRCARCGHEWTQVWPNQCDGDCPQCGLRHIAPHNNETTELPRHEKVALYNDTFRKTLSGGTVLLTAGVDELPDMVKAEALCTIAKYDAFSEDNDPYGEHDFGSFELCGRSFFWKIDLYEEPDVKDKNGETVVTRVLTIMRADEY